MSESSDSSAPFSWRGFWKTLGPGILWAGAAVGVSHLVQSTRAGAQYGFALAIPILIVLALKYPVFEFAQRYAAATGENLVIGYTRLGKPFLGLFMLICLGGGFIALAAVTFVTGGIAADLFGGLDSVEWSGVMLVAGLFLLLGGHFKWLDGVVKVIVLMLTVATIIAVSLAFSHGSHAVADTHAPSPFTLLALPFLLGLFGWMPCPIEFAAIASLWTDQREKETGHRPSVREARLDFVVGYVTTAVLAIFFLSLGALVMFGTGNTFPNSAAGFAAELVRLYTMTIGHWAEPFIKIAALGAMLSTTLTVLDAYPRAFDACMRCGLLGPPRQRGGYAWWLLATALIAFCIILFFRSSFLALITFATTISFLSGAIVGWMNLRVVTGPLMPEAHRPGRLMVLITWLGIIGMAVLGALYLL